MYRAFQFFDDLAILFLQNIPAMDFERRRVQTCIYFSCAPEDNRRKKNSILNKNKEERYSRVPRPQIPVTQLNRDMQAAKRD